MRLASLPLRLQILILIILASIPQTILLINQYAFSQQVVAQNIQADTANLVTSVSNGNESWETTIDNYLATLAKIDAVANGSPADCSKTLAIIKSSQLEYNNIARAEINGDVLCSAVPSDTIVNVSDRKYFQDAVSLKTFSAGEYQVGRITGKPSIIFGDPLFDAKGNVKQVLYIALDLQWLSNFPQRIGLPDGAVMDILDVNGNILSRYPDPDLWFGKNIADSDIFTQIKSQGGTKGTFTATGIDGVQRQFTFTVLLPLNNNDPKSAIYIAIGLSSAQVNQQVQMVLIRNIILLLISGGVVFLIAYVFANKSIISNVNSLVSATKKFSSDIHSRSGLKYDSSEVGQIAKAFDAMAQEIEDQTRVVRENEERLRLLLQNSSDLFVVLDEKLLVKSESASSEKILGRKQGELVNQNGLTHVHPDDKERVLEFIKKNIAREGILEPIEFRIQHTDGHYVVLEAIINNQLHNPKIAGLIMNARDISDRRKNEERLAELNTLRENFVGIVSHQMRTPLTSMRWNLETILGKDFGKLNEGQRKFLEGTKSATDIMIKKIDDYMQAVEIIKGNIVITKEPARLEQLAETVINEYRPQCEVKHISLKIKMPSEPLPLVAVDIDKIKQVIGQLLDNAVTYTKEHGQISLDVKKHASSVRIEISDTGIGIAEESKKLIYNAFYRAANALKMKPDASGLGLFIAQSYVTQHGGKMDFESNEGKGSSFWFDLPLD